MPTPYFCVHFNDESQIRELEEKLESLGIEVIMRGPFGGIVVHSRESALSRVKDELGIEDWHEC